jgi:hypothetical protein
MMVFRRRLFWKVYLTLLASLVAVTVLMGGLWWLFGESSHERFGAFRVRLNDEMVPARDNPPGAIASGVKRLSDEIGADVSVYGADGTLAAAHGGPIPLAANEDDERGLGPPRVMRIDLPDGRAVLARLRPPAPSPRRRILTFVLIVAGGVGLAAFPITARLTRRLEGLRLGVERWGAGALSPPPRASRLC